MRRSAPISLSTNSPSSTLERYLNVYSVTAAAAGVGMLALAQPASSTIVITNTNIRVPTCFSTAPCPVFIDFNKDGINDLQIMRTYYPEHSVYFSNLNAAALKAGGGIVAGPGTDFNYASCLLRGAKIGPSVAFKTNALLERTIGHAYGTTSDKHELYGKWSGNHPNRFLGVKFKISGKTHYGWVRITVSVSQNGFGVGATITEYGYETVANKTVKAGLAGQASSHTEAGLRQENPPAASLGVLSLGVDGLAWRREEEAVSN